MLKGGEVYPGRSRGEDLQPHIKNPTANRSRVFSFASGCRMQLDRLTVLNKSPAALHLIDFSKIFLGSVSLHWCMNSKDFFNTYLSVALIFKIFVSSESQRLKPVPSRNSSYLLLTEIGSDNQSSVFSQNLSPLVIRSLIL